MRHQRTSTNQLPTFRICVQTSMMIYTLKSLVQKFIIDLRTSIVSPKAAHGYQICRNHGVPSVPSLCQSTMLALLVSTLTALEDLSPQGWLREGEVDKSEVWNTSVQDILHTKHSLPPRASQLQDRLQAVKNQVGYYCSLGST